MSSNLSRLERKLGYSFKDQDLMVLALTHRAVVLCGPVQPRETKAK